MDSMKSTGHINVSNRLDNLFGIFNDPEVIKTDNGPPWDSKDVALFFKNRNIKHDSSIPLWPRSNDQVERFMQNINKVIRHATDFSTPWERVIDINVTTLS